MINDDYFDLAEAFNEIYEQVNRFLHNIIKNVQNPLSFQ